MNEDRIVIRVNDGDDTVTRIRIKTDDDVKVIIKN